MSNEVLASVVGSTENTTQNASLMAKEFCNKNKGWVRICDLEHDSEQLYQKWGDLTKKEKQPWIDEWGNKLAQEAWEETGYSKCKVPMLMVDSWGNTYKGFHEMKEIVNIMTIYKIK